jgi:hypothetical protein
MANTATHATVRLVLYDGQPYIESRMRPVDGDADGPIPKGKILVVRTPLLSPESRDDTESELIDDDGSDEAFCPECAAAGQDPNDVLGAMMANPFGGKRKIGRNDPCPCGSGRKYKRCCIN